MKTRRDFLRELIISVGGVTALTACGDAPVMVATATGEPGRFYTPEEMELVSRLSELIIPAPRSRPPRPSMCRAMYDGLMATGQVRNEDAHRRAAGESIALVPTAVSMRSMKPSRTLTVRTRTVPRCEEARRSRRLSHFQGLCHPFHFRHRAGRRGNCNGSGFPGAGIQMCS